MISVDLRWVCCASAHLLRFRDSAHNAPSVPLPPGWISRGSSVIWLSRQVFFGTRRGAHGAFSYKTTTGACASAFSHAVAATRCAAPPRCAYMGSALSFPFSLRISNSRLHHDAVIYIKPRTPSRLLRSSAHQRRSRSYRQPLSDKFVPRRCRI